MFSFKGGDSINAISAGLPNITGVAAFSGASDGYGKENAGALSVAFTGTACGSTQSGSGDVKIILNASNSNSIYGASDTVQPPALQLTPQIRY